MGNESLISSEITLHDTKNGVIYFYELGPNMRNSSVTLNLSVEKEGSYTFMIWH